MKTRHLKPITSLFCFYVFSSFVFLYGCSKKEETTCPSAFSIKANSTTPTVGETLTLSASVEKFNYIWNGPLNFHVEQSTGASAVSIDNIKINQSGWYTGSLTGTGCGVLVDSVFVDVKYKQGNPSCALTDNKASGTGIPDLSAVSVSKAYDASWNAMSLHASGTFGYPTYTFLFNSYNGHAEPKDGLYVTTDIQAFNPFQDANVIYGQCQYSSYFFKTQADQTVYVSHAGGKLRIAFCGLKMSGDNGNSVMVTSTFSGQFTEK
jgi:hypothetical protein